MRALRSRRRAVAAVVVCVAGPLCVTASSAAAERPSAFAPVQSGISVTALPGATSFGDTPASTPETVSFVLREQALGQLESEVERGFRGQLSVGAFAKRYGQSASNISALQSYLSQFGISTSVDADRVDVVATGTAGEFDQALAVQQHQYHVPRRPGVDGSSGLPAQTIHGIAAPPELPNRIASYVVAILGLTNYAPFASDASEIDGTLIEPQQGSANACLALTGVATACNLPSDFATNYGLGRLYHAGATGARQTVGVVSLAAVDSGAPEYFWQNVMGLAPSGRTLTVVNVDGGPGPPSFAAASQETDEDVEQAGGVAPGANVLLYQAPNTDFGYVDAFFEAASDNLAGTVSSSWAESETLLASSIVSEQESPGYEAAFDEAFLELAAQGQSGFLASGDSGAYTASADIGTTNLSVDSPSDSPFVTVAGGTTMPWSGTFVGPAGSASVGVTSQRTWGWDYLWQPVATALGVPESEVAETNVVGGGGGFSSIEGTPSYQRGVAGTSVFSAVPYLVPANDEEVDGIVEPTTWTFDPSPPVISGVGFGRAIPDLSADADPYTGYLVYSPAFGAVGGPALEGGMGGTSFVAPQLAGAAAVIDCYVGHRTGFWNPAIYAAASETASPFTPLSASGTSSDNVFYTATPGSIFNEGSGLGVPNLGALAFYLGG